MKLSTEGTAALDETRAFTVKNWQHEEEVGKWQTKVRVRLT
jgi:hypothetical protein